MKVERWEAERINRELLDCLNYLSRQQGSMIQGGFFQDDTLLQLVRKAYDGVFSLRVELLRWSRPTASRRSTPAAVVHEYRRLG